MMAVLIGGPVALVLLLAETQVEFRAAGKGFGCVRRALLAACEGEKRPPWGICE